MRLGKKKVIFAVTYPSKVIEAKEIYGGRKVKFSSRLKQFSEKAWMEEIFVKSSLKAKGKKSNT